MFLELMACDAVLRIWKENPATKRRDYRVFSGWDLGSGADEPLSLREVAWRKEFLRLHNLSAFRSRFPEQVTVVVPCAQKEEVVQNLFTKQPFRPFSILTSMEHALEIDKAEIVAMLPSGVKVLQRWGPPGKPPVERTIWALFGHIRHLEWHDLQSSPVIEFAG